MASLSFFNIGQNRYTGWKKAAQINCLELIAMSVALVACLIAAASQVGDIRKPLFFYGGGCDGGSVSQINTALHLLINVISTLVVTVLP
ncbi:hypothetical protein GGR52DRAFT_529627 [Hypoxylon sp. FL1284]|nr:hypothetical protein GGR52DRAFT_529627 [Hypoxylon sp. FL1284]